MVSRYRLTPLLLALLASPAFAAASNAALPAGATSIQEGYEDWRVACAQQGQATQCSMSQQQLQQNGQMVLAIELTKSDAGASGNLVLPFGLDLSQGAVLQIDDGAPLPLQAFKTCLPVGCIVPVSFDAATLDGLGKGKVLKISVAASDTEHKTTFGVSLKGFISAFNRITALSSEPN